MNSTLDRLIQVFSRNGHAPQSAIGQLQFLMLLDRLLGSQFDREVALQLWEQADLDQNGNAESQQLCQIIEDAQNILVEKLRQINLTIQNIHMRQQQLTQSNVMGGQQRVQQLQMLSSQISELQKDHREYGEDLYLVSFPFGINLGTKLPNLPNPLQMSAMAAMRMSGMAGNSLVAGNPLVALAGSPILVQDIVTTTNMVESGQFTSNSNMSLLFWLGIVFGLLEVVVMFEKYDFLNLLVFVCIISIFLLNYFDRNYIVLCIALTGLSVIMDGLWILLYGGKHWNPPAVGQYSAAEWGYLRVIVFFTILQIFVKVGMILLLLRQRNLPESSGFVIDMPKLTIFGNRRNLISQHVDVVTGSRF